MLRSVFFLLIIIEVNWPPMTSFALHEHDHRRRSIARFVPWSERSIRRACGQCRPARIHCTIPRLIMKMSIAINN